MTNTGKITYEEITEAMQGQEKLTYSQYSKAIQPMITNHKRYFRHMANWKRKHSEANATTTKNEAQRFRRRIATVSYALFRAENKTNHTHKIAILRKVLLPRTYRKLLQECRAKHTIRKYSGIDEQPQFEQYENDHRTEYNINREYIQLCNKVYNGNLSLSFKD